MTESELQILIKLIADTKGADAASAALKEINTQAHQVGDAQVDVGKAGQEAGEKMAHGAHESAHEAHELHMILRLLGPYLGEIGHLAHAAMFGELVFGIAAAVIAAKTLFEAFEKLKKPIDEFNEALLQIDSVRLKAASDAASELATSLADSAREQGNLQAAFERGTTAMDNRIKKYGEEVDAVLKVEEAKEKAYEADIEQQEAEGKITKETADELKAKAKLELDAHRGATDQSKLKFEIEQRSAELDQANYRIRGNVDARNFAAAKAAEAAPEAAYEKAKKEAELAAKQPFQAEGQNFETIDDAKKRALEVRGYAQENTEQGDTIGAAQYTAQAEAIERAAAGQQKYIDNLQAIADKSKVALDAAKNVTKQAADQQTTDLNVVTSGREKIKSLQDQYNIQHRTIEQTTAINTHAAATRTQTGREAEANTVAAGRGSPAQQAEVARRMATWRAQHIGGTTDTADDAVKLVMHAIDSSRELSKTGSGSSFDIRQLSKTADVAKRAADAATLSTESTTVAKHLKDIDDAIAQMSGFAANTSSSLSGLHLNVKTSLDQLKLARDETAALAQRLKNVATNVTQ